MQNIVATNNTMFAKLSPNLPHTNMLFSSFFVSERTLFLALGLCIIHIYSTLTPTDPCSLFVQMSVPQFFHLFIYIVYLYPSVCLSVHWKIVIKKYILLTRKSAILHGVLSYNKMIFRAENHYNPKPFLCPCVIIGKKQTPHHHHHHNVITIRAVPGSLGS